MEGWIEMNNKKDAKISELEKRLKEFEEKKRIFDAEYKNGFLMWPLRTAVSGKQMTPCGATEIMEIIGKEETIARVKKGIILLQNALNA